MNVLPGLEGHCIREELNMSLVFFEQGFDAMKECGVEFNKLLFDVIAHQIQTLSTHYCYFGSIDEAIEIYDVYLNEVKENGTFSDEEYRSIEKEFREQIYIL